MADYRPGYTVLDAVFEESFQKWYAQMAMLQGVSMNPDDPEHYYDYRGWYKSGISGGRDWHDEGRMHGPDDFKMPGHPNTLWAANQIMNEGVSIRPEMALGMQARLFNSLLGMK